MVGDPTQNDECRTSNGTEPKNDEFRIVLSNLTDGAFGKGRFMMVVLRLVVDDDETEYCAYSSYFVE